MYGFLLQDWTAVRLAYNVASITQGESDWVDLREYRDLVVWLEVRSIDLLATGVTGLVVNYETSPTKDDSMFSAAATSSTLTAALPNPEVRKVILNTNPTVPLARWLRWKVAAIGTGTAGVSVLTMRIAASANAIGRASATAQMRDANGGAGVVTQPLLDAVASRTQVSTKTAGASIEGLMPNHPVRARMVRSK